jgi:hypothetical protein
MALHLFLMMRHFYKIRLREIQEGLQAKAKESEIRAEQMQKDKVALEKTALQLQHERLMVAKQRMQSRHFLDGAKKLEHLLQHQKALEHVITPSPPFVSPKSV